LQKLKRECEEYKAKLNSATEEAATKSSENEMLKKKLEQQDKSMKFLNDLVIVQKRALNEGIVKSLEMRKSVDSLINENQKLQSKLQSTKRTQSRNPISKSPCLVK
jgi:regulator of replication initiation timing